MTESCEHWQDHEIAGHHTQVLEPGEPRPEIALLILPGWGERAGGEEALTALLREAKVRAIAPVATTWWLDSIEPDFDDNQTPQDFLQRDLLEWMARTWDVAPPNIRLLGWETGGQGVFQLAFRRSRDFPRLAAIDPAIDFHDLHGRDPSVTDLFANWEAARQQTALLRLHPAGWPRYMMLIADRHGFWFEGGDRLAMKLHSTGIPLETVFYPDTDHPKVTDRPGALRRGLEHVLRESLEFPVIGA